MRGPLVLLNGACTRVTKQPWRILPRDSVSLWISSTSPSGSDITNDGQNKLCTRTGRKSPFGTGPKESDPHILAQLNSRTVGPLHDSLELNSQEDGPGAPSGIKKEDPFEFCARAEITRMLIAAVDSLSKKERQALALYCFEERTIKEVGRAFDLHESRVSQIIGQAVDRLRTRLRKIIGRAQNMSPVA